MMRNLLLILALCCFAFQVRATCGSRCFGATCGTSNTADQINSGYSTALTTQHSFSVCVNANTYAPSGSTGVLFGLTGGGNWNWQTSSATNTFRIGEKFSGTSGSWNFPLSLNAWHCFAFSYDGSSTSNDPIVYEDGVLQTLSTVVRPTGSFGPSSGAIYIGNANNSRPFGGSVGDLAYWANTSLATNDLIALSNNVSPLKIGTKPTFYYPLCGIGTTEPDWGPSHLTSTVTSTKQGPSGPPRNTYPQIVYGQ